MAAPLALQTDRCQLVHLDHTWAPQRLDTARSRTLGAQCQRWDLRCCRHMQRRRLGLQERRLPADQPAAAVAAPVAARQGVWRQLAWALSRSPHLQLVVFRNCLLDSRQSSAEAGGVACRLAVHAPQGKHQSSASCCKLSYVCDTSTSDGDAVLMAKSNAFSRALQSLDRFWMPGLTGTLPQGFRPSVELRVLNKRTPDHVVGKLSAVGMRATSPAASRRALRTATENERAHELRSRLRCQARQRAAGVRLEMIRRHTEIDGWIRGTVTNRGHADVSLASVSAPVQALSARATVASDDVHHN